MEKKKTKKVNTLAKQRLATVVVPFAKQEKRRKKYRLFSSSLIRHCWRFHLYKKKVSQYSYAEKFVNCLMVDGKKGKSYTLLAQTALLIRKKLIEKEKFFFPVQDRVKTIEHIKQLFLITQLIKRKKVEDKPSALIKKKEKISIKLRNKKPKKNKKNTIEKIQLTQEKKNQNPQNPKKKRKIQSFSNFLLQAINNVKPCLEVRKVRIGRRTYLVPAILSEKRQETLAIKWIIDASRAKKKNGKYPFALYLANELFDAYFKQGQARQKRNELHKLAQSNRAHTRYRWW